MDLHNLDIRRFGRGLKSAICSAFLVATIVATSRAETAVTLYPPGSTDYIQILPGPMVSTISVTLSTSLPSANQIPIVSTVVGNAITMGWGAASAGGGTWGSITGTLSTQTDLQNALNAIGASTNTLNATTATLSASTTTLQTQLNSLAASTGTLQTQINSVATSTGVLSVSTSSIQTQINGLASTYLTNSSATATYLQDSSATLTYLNQTVAASTYLTQSSATATYLQLSSATATYQPKGSYLTANQTITLSGDATGSGATAIAVTAAANQANIKTLSASSETVSGNLLVTGWAIHAGSETVSAAGGLGVTFGVIAGSVTVSSENVTGALTANSEVLTNALPVASGGTGTASPSITAGTNITSVTGTWPNVTINAATQGGSGASLTSSNTWTAGQSFNSFTNLSGTTTISGGVFISSAINIAIPSVITTTMTITSTMSIILASCSSFGTTNSFITVTLPSASASSGYSTDIYDVGPDSCSIHVQAAGSDVIIDTGTWYLNAKHQMLSIRSLGSSGWGCANGNCVATPFTAWTTQDDVGTYTASASSVVYHCPIYLPTPVALLGFRADRPSNTGTGSFSINDMKGHWLTGVSTVTLTGNPSNYLLATVYQLAPGWYQLLVELNNSTVQLSGSNSVNDVTMLCGEAGTNTTQDLSQFTPTLTGGVRNRNYPAIDLLINGGDQGN
jgi:hypothetical protein